MHKRGVARAHAQAHTSAGSGVVRRAHQSIVHLLLRQNSQARRYRRAPTLHTQLCHDQQANAPRTTRCDVRAAHRGQPDSLATLYYITDIVRT